MSLQIYSNSTRYHVALTNTYCPGDALRRAADNIWRCDDGNAYLTRIGHSYSVVPKSPAYVVGEGLKAVSSCVDAFVTRVFSLFLPGAAASEVAANPDQLLQMCEQESSPDKEQACRLRALDMQHKRDRKDMGIDPRGFWYGEAAIEEHRFDQKLAIGLVRFFRREKATEVVDFGCGTGLYVKMLRANKIPCKGYDGNPDTPHLSEGIAEVLDLSEPFDLKKRFDWVMSLEVAEHLPPQYEQTYLDNLNRHNTKGILLSWALKGQGGAGHFNEQNNDYVIRLMQHNGYIYDRVASEQLRKDVTYPWFRNTIMVFRRNQPSTEEL